MKHLGFSASPVRFNNQVLSLLHNTKFRCSVLDFMYNESESVQNDMISYLPTDVSTAPISLFKPSCQGGTGRKAPKHNLFIVTPSVTCVLQLTPWSSFKIRGRNRASTNQDSKHHVTFFIKGRQIHSQTCWPLTCLVTPSVGTGVDVHVIGHTQTHTHTHTHTRTQSHTHTTSFLQCSQYY